MSTETERILMTLLDTEIGSLMKNVDEETRTEGADTLYVFTKAEMALVIATIVGRCKKLTDTFAGDIPPLREMHDGLDVNNVFSPTNEAIKKDFFKKLGRLEASGVLLKHCRMLLDECTFLESR